MAVVRLTDEMIYAALRNPGLPGALPQFGPTLIAFRKLSELTPGKCAPCTMKQRRSSVHASALAVIGGLNDQQKAALKPFLGVPADAQVKAFRKGPRGLEEYLF